MSRGNDIISAVQKEKREGEERRRREKEKREGEGKKEKRRRDTCVKGERDTCEEDLHL